MVGVVRKIIKSQMQFFEHKLNINVEFRATKHTEFIEFVVYFLNTKYTITSFEKPKQTGVSYFIS